MKISACAKHEVTSASLRPDSPTLNGSLWLTAALVCASLLSSTLLIPAVRPFMAWAAPGNESAAHAFMAVNLLGGVLAAPLLMRVVRRMKSPARWVMVLAILDASMLLLLATGPSVRVLLTIRALQGALGISALSVLLGAAPRGGATGSGARYGLLGSAMMIGVAAGGPLGTLCLGLGSSAPLLIGALLQMAVACLVFRARLELGASASDVRPRVPWLAMAWVFAERFAVGLFVVTFAFHARGCLGLSDSTVGVALSAFLLPFALAVYPCGRLVDRVGTTRLAATCLAIYGVGFLLLPYSTAAWLIPCMALLGLSSAAVFAACMREAAGSCAAGARVAAMSALNSAGGLGMLLGTAIAGTLSALLRTRGYEAHAAHQLSFQLGGLIAVAVATLGFAFTQRASAQSGAQWQRS